MQQLFIVTSRKKLTALKEVANKALDLYTSSEVEDYIEEITKNLN